MLPVCADFGFFHWLFYLTGALIWGFVAVCLIFVTALASYHAVGATIFAFRVFGLLKRNNEKFPLKSKAHYWWHAFLGDYRYGSERHRVTGEIARWPRPWYRKTQDENLEQPEDAPIEG